MCLSTLGKIIERDDLFAKVDMQGIEVEVNLSLVPEIEVGEWVLIHAGFAIQKYEEEEALETLALLREALGHAPPS